MNPYLLEVIACPKSKEPLSHSAGSQELIAITSKLAYPIRNGLPIMIVEEARPLTDEAIQQLLTSQTDL